MWTKTVLDDLKCHNLNWLKQSSRLWIGQSGGYKWQYTLVMVQARNADDRDHKLTNTEP